ncbi:MAG TPA: hypothetical protein VGF94_06055 [Kofleriaceae bacterium]|jgi:hypothetical protein
MKPIKSILVLAIMLGVPGLAGAQGYYGGGYGPAPIPGGFHHRMGALAWGFSIGLGGMSDNGSGITSCDNCDVNPVAFEVDGHIGGMVSPRLALLAEVQGNGQTVHSDAFNGDTVLTQSALMFAAQYWLTPQIWVKGGIGVADLQAQDSDYQIDFGEGVAVMGAVGFELMSARRFALDLQGRIIEGTYNSGDDHITSGTVGLGFNWY